MFREPRSRVKFKYQFRSLIDRDAYRRANQACITQLRDIVVKAKINQLANHFRAYLTVSDHRTYRHRYQFLTSVFYRVHGCAYILVLTTFKHQREAVTGWL